MTDTVIDQEVQEEPTQEPAPDLSPMPEAPAEPVPESEPEPEVKRPTAPDPAPPAPAPEPEPVPPPAPIELAPPKQWAQVQKYGPDVLGFFLQDSAPLDTDEYRYVLIDPPFNSADTPRSTPTEVLRWRGGTVLAWEETGALDAVVAHAVDQIDTAADEVRKTVVAKQTNTIEYEQAEIQARQFKEAGYPESAVPDYVQAWAEAKHRQAWTARMAADDIIDTADRWKALLIGIRRLRLVAKEDVRHAATAGAIKARVQQFLTDLAAMTGA